MANYTFSEDFSELNSKPYLEVYKNQNLSHQDYFHHPEFQYACISVFSKYEKCYLLSVKKDEILIGYMAFRMAIQTVRKIKYRFLVPIGYNLSEYNYPIINKRYINEFFMVLNEALINFNVFFQYIPAFFRKKILDSVKNSFVHRPVNVLILKRVGNDILRASEKKTPARRKRQLIVKFDNIEVNHLTNNISQKLLDIFFKMHIKRWQKDGMTSNFKLNSYREFLHVFSTLKIKNIGFPVFSYLKVNDDFVAMHFGVISNKRFFYLIPAANIKKKVYSAGAILKTELLKFIYIKDIEIYSMGVGDEAYKYRYMNDIETYFNILKFKNPIHSFINRIGLKN